LILSNTCTIDYFLLAIWTSWILSNRPDNYLTGIHLSNRLPFTITRIINKIDLLKWNEARFIWIHEVLKLPITINKQGKPWLNTWGNTYDMFYNKIRVFQEFSYTISCSDGCINNNNTRNCQDLFFDKENELVSLSRNYVCRICKKPITQSVYTFKHDPVWLFIQAIQSTRKLIYFKDLPINLSINNTSFKLLCATIYSMKHFKSIFYIDNTAYLVDDLKPNERSKEIPKIKIDICFYYKI
jgi:hypothetical protein